MATTTIEVIVAVGTTAVTLTPRAGATGTAAVSYAPTQVVGQLHTIAVTQALTGDWVAIGEADEQTALNDLVDEEITVKLGNRNLAPEIAAVKTDTGNLVARLGAWTGSGINTVLGAMRALAAKAAGLTPTDLSTGTTFDNTTDSLEAIRDRGDAAWTTGAGGGGVSEDVNVVSVGGVAVTGPNDISITLASPVSELGTRFDLVQGDDYTGTRKIRLSLIGSTDLTSYSLVFAARNGNTNIVQVFSIDGTDETDQYADITFSRKVTRRWPIDTYDLVLKVRDVDGNDQTLKTGKLYVSPFDIPPNS